VSACMELLGTNGNQRDILILVFFPRDTRCVVSLLSSFQVATGAKYLALNRTLCGIRSTTSPTHTASCVPLKLL